MSDKLLTDRELDALAKAWREFHAEIGMGEGPTHIYYTLAYAAAGLRRALMENAGKCFPNMPDEELTEGAKKFRNPAQLVETVHVLFNSYARQLTRSEPTKHTITVIAKMAEESKDEVDDGETIQ